jgi:hypothetical protein
MAYRCFHLLTGYRLITALIERQHQWKAAGGHGPIIDDSVGSLTIVVPIIGYFSGLVLVPSWKAIKRKSNKLKQLDP